MLGLRYLCPASDEVGGGESSQRTSLPDDWNQSLQLMLNWWAFEAINLMRTTICGRSRIRVHRSSQGKTKEDPDILLAFTLKICVVVSVPEGLANFGTRHQ